MKRLLLLLLLTACATADDIASGTVEATEAQLGFTIAGRIDSILVREGDRVRTGQRLAVLDQDDLRARRQAAQGTLDAARALLAELESGARVEEVAQAREALRVGTERFTDAERDLARVRRLFEGGAVSQEALDRAITQHGIARAQREQAQQQLQLIEAGPRRERIAAQRGVVQQAEAALRQIDIALDNAVITAPFDAVVTTRDREPGETTAPGAPVLTLMNPSDRWVRIYVREDQIGTVRIGQSAAITTDSWPDSSFAGAVSFISSQAEFTPRNVQTAEERVKLVYAVKVRVTGDSASALKPGMPADVRLQ